MYILLNQTLINSLLSKEVQQSVQRAPGPDEFPKETYQDFWPIGKEGIGLAFVAAAERKKKACRQSH